jgi:hypothetical protein
MTKETGKEQTMELSDFSRAGVFGDGTMGAGIAGLFAESGL